ncbi:hypothetical protein evm_015097 [Chilo suppressalis]|nr:hypothetical protein evm_015097 [Chilo suppressalis]
MVKYSAYRCESAIYNRTPGLTFHQFPKDESARNAWLKYMKRQDWQPNTYSVLSVFCFKINISNDFNSLIKFICDYVDYSIFDSNNPDHDINHVHLLIKVVITFYFDLRCKHQRKETIVSQRNFLKKLALFQNK